MATTKDALYTIVDVLSDEQAEAVLGFLRGVVEANEPPGHGWAVDGLLVSGHEFFGAALKTWQELAAEQGVRPIAFDELLGDGGPDGESVDDMIATLREWRRQGGYA